MYRTGVICRVVTPKDNVKINKASCKVGIWKIGDYMWFHQRQDQVWSSPLAMLLLKLGTAGLLKTKIEWENSIPVQNWGYVWGRHNQDNIWINKAHFHKNNRKKIKSFSHKKKSIWCFVIEVISFNFNDNFIIAREPMAGGTIFYNCLTVSVVQTAWMVNCGYQRVVVKKETSLLSVIWIWKRSSGKYLKNWSSFITLSR